MNKPNRKVKRTRVDEATRMARLLLPAAQVMRGSFKVVDVANHSEADQRRMVRSGEKRTIRRRSHIEHLTAQLNLDQRESAALSWYADAHSARYDTLNVIAAYGDRGGRSSSTDFDHLPDTPEQSEARENYDIGRDAIEPTLIRLFERIVVLEWLPTRNIEGLFRIALNQLLNRIEGMIPLCD